MVHEATESKQAQRLACQENEEVACGTASEDGIGRSKSWLRWLLAQGPLIAGLA